MVDKNYDWLFELISNTSAGMLLTYGVLILAVAFGLFKLLDSDNHSEIDNKK